MLSSYAADAAGFLEVSEPTLLTILQMEYLDMGEVELFKVVEAWAAFQLSKKDVKVTGPVKHRSNCHCYIGSCLPLVVKI